jgi:hypothetical protein
LFVPKFWAGVNLGATIPGHDPGELAITRAEYARWLTEMGALGVRVIRVYTLQRPVFYDALASYDRRHPHAPLWLLQGIYLDQGRLDSVHNAYDAILTAETDRDIRDAVGALHGNADIPARPGLASGRYRTSVSRWLLGWSFGVEWDPTTTLLTDQANAAVARFQGTYFTATANATPLGELDRRKARFARHRGGPPRLERAAHVHQLGDHRSAEPSRGAASDRG